MKCPKCQGLKYLEYEAGLIRLPCQECKGTGEIPDDNPSAVSYTHLTLPTILRV